MELWVVDPEAGVLSLRRVAPRMEPGGMNAGRIPPAWAADDRIVYFEGTYPQDRQKGASKNIYRVHLETGEMENVGPGWRPASDAKGECVVYNGMPYGTGVYLVEDHRGEPKLVEAGQTGPPQFSPSGKYISFFVQAIRKKKIIVRATSEEILLPHVPGPDKWIRSWPASVQAPLVTKEAP